MYLDHINGDKDDNRFENLREIANDHNCRRAKRGGIDQLKSGKWRARFWHPKHGKMINLGSYSTETEAKAAQEAAMKVARLRFD